MSRINVIMISKTAYTVYHIKEAKIEREREREKS